MVVWKFVAHAMPFLIQNSQAEGFNVECAATQWNPALGLDVGRLLHSNRILRNSLLQSLSLRDLALRAWTFVWAKENLTFNVPQIIWVF